MVAFRFCPNCNNSLYPIEDKNTRTLLFLCRHCERKERAVDTCVYKTSFTLSSEDKSVSTDNISNDPTFPRLDITCPLCNYNQAVFFQSRSKRRDASMKLFFICSNPQCNHRWVGADTPNTANITNQP